MNKSNNYKKLYNEDKFARKYYCDHAKENQIRVDKKAEKKKVRSDSKRIVYNILNKIDDN